MTATAEINDISQKNRQKVAEKGFRFRYGWGDAGHPTTNENLKPKAFAISIKVESCMSV